MQATETEGLEGKLDDENSGTADLSGVERESRLPLCEKLVLLDLQLLGFFESSVEQGILSFAAAPSGPAICAPPQPILVSILRKRDAPSGFRRHEPGRMDLFSRECANGRDSRAASPQFPFQCQRKRSALTLVLQRKARLNARGTPCPRSLPSQNAPPVKL